MISYIVQYQRVDKWKDKNQISWINCPGDPINSIVLARKIKKYNQKRWERKARIVKTVTKRSIVK